MMLININNFFLKYEYISHSIDKNVHIMNSCRAIPLIHLDNLPPHPPDR